MDDITRDLPKMGIRGWKELANDRGMKETDIKGPTRGCRVSKIKNEEAL